MTVTVGNANVSDNIANVLALWQEGNGELLLSHIKTINNVQDFLCRIITEEASEHTRAAIGALLGDIVCIKDDLKELVVEKGDLL